MRFSFLKIRTFLLSGMLLLLFLSGVFIFSSTAGDSQKTYSTVWDDRIQHIGPETAYSELIEQSGAYSKGALHEMAHEFGGALYRNVGLEGILVCDTQFDYGCYHEFLGKAIADQGVGILRELNEQCQSLLSEPGFCQHGIGHGIQAHVGYEKSDLKEALRLCSALPGNDPIGGCIGGVFMEYNFRTMLAEESTLREDTSLSSPCQDLQGAQQDACLFWQPQWWHGSLGYGKDESTFATLGEHCRAVHNQLQDTSLDTCLRGIGNILGTFDSVTTTTVQKLCMSADSSSRVCSEHGMQFVTAVGTDLQ